jgi:hypothetical protein
VLPTITEIIIMFCSFVGLLFWGFLKLSGKNPKSDEAALSGDGGQLGVVLI